MYYHLFLVIDIQIVVILSLPRIRPTLENSFVYGFDSPWFGKCDTLWLCALFFWFLHKVFTEEFDHWLVVVEWFRSQICLTQLGTHEHFVRCQVHHLDELLLLKLVEFADNVKLDLGSVSDEEAELHYEGKANDEANR